MTKREELEGCITTLRTIIDNAQKEIVALRKESYLLSDNVVIADIVDRACWCIAAPFVSKSGVHYCPVCGKDWIPKSVDKH